LVTPIRGTNNEQGTGLGLQLCKVFVEKNNGKIWVTTAWGKGSIFYFTAPMAIYINSGAGKLTGVELT
jgi:K+-sensing histidine kinase KdpD